MKNIIITIAAILSLNSCQSQNSADLLQLKFGNSIDNIVSKENYKEDTDIVYGMLSYRTDEIKGLKIGATPIQTYDYTKASLAYYNVLYLFVENQDNNRYLGFNYSTVNQEDTKKIIDNIKQNYKNIDDRSDRYREAYFIDIPDKNAWLFINQSIGNDDGKQFFTTDFTYVKRDTRLANSTDPTYDTFLESFNKTYPPKEK